jgi:hypothetical protein
MPTVNIAIRATLRKLLCALIAPFFWASWNRPHGIEHQQFRPIRQSNAAKSLQHSGVVLV